MTYTYICIITDSGSVEPRVEWFFANGARRLCDDSFADELIEKGGTESLERIREIIKEAPFRKLDENPALYQADDLVFVDAQFRGKPDITKMVDAVGVYDYQAHMEGRVRGLLFRLKELEARE